MPKKSKREAPKNHVSFGSGDMQDFEAAARRAGHSSVAEYFKSLHQQEQGPETPVIKAPKKSYPALVKGRLGKGFHGDALGYMHHIAEEQSVDLVMTSPPFGLVRKKSYGNEDAEAYCDWFRPFAEGFKRILKDKGSLVIDIGGAWKKGYPVRSLYHYELLIMLCKEYGFHLCLEHFWWNPAKLPSPAEWVNVRRIRVKDAVNCVWWLSPTPWPKASNRRVLAPYSKSMKSLIKGGYRAKLRPSGHDISDKFQRDNGGSVPPNLLAIANTESNSAYQQYCRDRELPVHPARFPSLLPEYFIRMLTDRDDLVYDPFGGSCMTGWVAEHLGRRWACTELNKDYLKGAKGRFLQNPPLLPAVTAKGEYTIHTPCLGAGAGDDEPLPADGGQKRAPKKSG